MVCGFVIWDETCFRMFRAVLKSTDTLNFENKLYLSLWNYCKDFYAYLWQSIDVYSLLSLALKFSCTLNKIKCVVVLLFKSTLATHATFPGSFGQEQKLSTLIRRWGIRAVLDYL